MRRNFNARDEAFEIVAAGLHHVTCCLYMYVRSIEWHRQCEARDDDERKTNRRETHKAKSVALRESRIWGEC